MSTTALGMSMTAAMADDNEAYLTQTGNDNTSIITQNTGDRNRLANAGTPGLQDGDFNQLILTQVGNDNVVAKFDQVTTNDEDAGFTATDTNFAVVLQDTNDNTISELRQRSDAMDNTAGLNVVDVIQDGGDGNDIGRIWQFGTNSLIDTWQTGTNNKIANVFQYGTSSSNFSNGADNIVIISQLGDDNGRATSLTGDYSGFTLSAFGGPPWSKFSTNAVNQRGTNHFASLDMAGDGNNFGVLQVGDDNFADFIVTGDTNSFSADQVGILNTAFGDIIGNGNSIGIAQGDGSTKGTIGGGNLASADVSGDGNRGRMTQLGVDNFADLWVEGDDNTSAMDVVGDDNYLEAQQRFGDNNLITTNVFGDRNNAIDPVTGDAATAFAAADGETGLTMFTGSLWQHGSGNSLILNVGTSGVDANDNLFATLQRGDDNDITGTINGNNNQAVVAQIGDSNTAVFTQTGNNNNVGIIQ